MDTSLQSAIAGAGFACLVVVGLLYLSYMTGLIVALHRMGKLSWMAFVPLLNYYAQMRAVRAPGRWFFLTWIPYLGFAYAGTIMIRFGAVFRRGPAFSVFWLTVGAPVGVWLLLVPKGPLHLELLDGDELKLLDVRAIKRQHKRK